MRLFKTRKSGDIHSLPATTIIAIGSESLNTEDSNDNCTEQNQTKQPFDKCSNEIPTDKYIRTNSGCDNHCSSINIMRNHGSTLHMTQHRTEQIYNNHTINNQPYIKSSQNGSNMMGNYVVVAHNHNSNTNEISNKRQQTKPQLKDDQQQHQIHPHQQQMSHPRRHFGGVVGTFNYIGSQNTTNSLIVGKNGNI